MEAEKSLKGVSSSIASDAETQPLLGTSLSVSKTTRWMKIVRGAGTGMCIVLMVVSWLTMAEKLQAVGDKYEKPFFQAYFIHSSYTLIYIAWKIWLIFPGNFSCNRVGEGKLTNFKWLAISTGVLAVVIYASAFLWYLSLTRTSISANTSVYQSASAVVFIISIPVLRERVTLLKIFSVVLTVGGVCMVSIFTQDHNPAHVTNNTLTEMGGAKRAVWGGGGALGVAADDPEKTTPLGYIYLVVSTILYAVAEVGFKKFATKPDDPATVQNGVRSLGYMGVHTLFWFWPLLVVLHFTGLERFELPPLDVMQMLFLNALLDLIFNAGLFVCIALSSPLIATIGSVLVVPASVIVDWLVNHKFLDWEAYVGITLIICGFFVLVFSETWEIFYWEKKLEQDPVATARLDLAEGKIPSTSDVSIVNTSRKRKKFLYYII